MPPSSELTQRVVATLARLEQCEKNLPLTMGEQLAREHHRDPFILLISCLLSLRARDTATYPVCKQLFSRVRTPHELLALPVHELEQVLKPIGFYRNKAATLRKVCNYIIHECNGIVPSDYQSLLKIPGVGPKTANFMLCLAYQTPAICVDTHVHRLANLFGWVTTNSPAATEHALHHLVPESWWCRLNNILVRWGQHVCTPRLSPAKRHDPTSFHGQHCPCPSTTRE